jgi:hypothetical protein
MIGLASSHFHNIMILMNPWPKPFESEQWACLAFERAFGEKEESTFPVSYDMILTVGLPSSQEYSTMLNDCRLQELYRHFEDSSNQLHMIVLSMHTVSHWIILTTPVNVSANFSRMATSDFWIQLRFNFCSHHMDMPFTLLLVDATKQRI